MEEDKSKTLINHIMKYSLDMVCTIDSLGRFIQVSPASNQILGYTPEELAGQFVKEFLHSPDGNQTIITAPFQKLGVEATNYENTYIHKNGKEIKLSWSAIWLEGNDFFFCIARNTTAQKPAVKEIDLHHLLVEHGSDMHALLDKNGNYLYVAGASLKKLGYEPEQLIGVNAFQLLHPEDIAKAKEALIQVQQSQEPIKLAEIRFKTADGQWCWVETTVSNQLQNPAIQALFVSSRDISQSKQAQSQLIESEQRFRSLFENNPDIVLYQNEAGVILDANPSFLSFIKKSKEAIINHSLTDFLPGQVTSLFQQKLKEAFSGIKVSFEVEINFEQLGYKVLSVVKVPLIVGEKVVAVHAVFKDITETTVSHRIIEQQAQKLNTIFESITDAFFTLDKAWNFTLINQEFDRLFGTNRHKLIGRNIWSVFPGEITQKLYQPYHQAAATGKTIHLELFLEAFQIWVEIRVFPSEEGLSVYFDDVTEKVAAKEELKKLSLVARKTTNSVIITDADGLTEWVNEGFTNMTGYTLAEIAGKKPGEILQGPETDLATVQRIREKLKTGMPFTDEILNYKKSGEKFWIYKEITPILNEAGEIEQFIAIQNDVTERKKAEEEFRKLSLVASKTTHGVIILSPEMQTEWVNEGFTRMTGFTLADILGKKPGDLLEGPGTDKEAVSQMWEKLKEGVPFYAEICIYRKSGEGFWVSIDFSPVSNEQGKIMQYIAIQKDITFRKEAEANLLKMSKDLYEHNRDLQQFTYIVSHNLRSPVANASGLAKLLVGLSKESAEFDIMLQYLYESVTRLDDVLKDINLILSIRDKKDIVEKENIRLSDICQQTLSDLQDPLELCYGQVNVNIANELQVQGNRAYLYSIFYNLLSNAIKYRSENRRLHINIKAAQSPEGVKIISFSDNGTGFDMKKAGDNIFKLYKRFHTNKEGKGIGLFLVKTHLEAMEGRIEVNSQVGVGTSFTIYLN